MRHNLLILLWSMAVFMGLTTLVEATPIFIDFEGLPTYTVVGNKYAALGLTFYQARIVTENKAPLAGIDFNLLDNNFLANDPPTYGYPGAIGIYSSDPMYKISFDFARLYDPSISTVPPITVKVYDGLLGSLIAENKFTGTAVTGTTSVNWAEGFAEMIVPGGFDSVVIMDSGKDVGIDNLSIQRSPAPIPSPIALLGFSLIGLLGIRRKKAMTT